MASHPTLELKIHVSATYSVNAYDTSGLFSNQIQLLIYNSTKSRLYASFADNRDYHYGPNGSNITYNGWDDLSYANGVLSGDLTIPVDYTSIGYLYSIQYLLNANADIGNASIDSENSLHLVGLTLADGTTPESHGIEVSTASGMLSPNASAVPELPSSAIAGTGVLIGLAYTWTRRRRVASEDR